MKKNSKISVALHSLVHIAKSQQPLTSEQLALCFNTNPVVIRRILGKLRKSGIVSSEKGHGGGWTMAVPYQKVSFYDIYASLEEELLPTNNSNMEEQCLIMKTLNQTMDEFLLEANELLNQKLRNIKLKNIINKVDEK